MKALILAGLFVFLLQYSAAQTGPGGVGSSDGTSTLKLWFRSDNGVGVTGSAVNSWSNSAGIPALDISETGTERPTQVTGAVNGFSEISFNGTNRLRTGLTLTTSNFVTNQAASFVVVRADNTTQSSSIYLTDPLDVNRFSNHIPWSGSVYYDIGNCCGNEARLEVGGLTGLTGYSVWSYNATPASGKQVYRDGTLLQDRALTSTYSSHATQRFNIGGNIAGSAGFAGDITEVIIFNAGVNAAQRILIQNYLAAKYGLALGANDVYTEDDSGFDFDVAGIGRVNGSNIHDDARGTGIVRVFNPSGLDNNNFFMWGHDNGDLEATNTSDIPTGVSARFDRVWRASETGEVGDLDMEFDLSGLPDFAACDALWELRLLIDTDDNNDFDDETPISGATNMGGNIYRFTNINIEDDERFTLAIYYPAIEGPGGVGTGLQMWWRADAGVSTTAGLVTDWGDQSGNGNNLVSPSGSRPVTATSAAMNGQTVMRYSGAQYFTSAFSGPGVNNLTLFLTANGTNYQSLLRFQNTAGTYVVYPWETGRTFISSSDGGTASGVASGLVNNVNNVGGARYRRNTTNGMQTYLNGAINAQRNSINNVLPTQPFYSGRYSGGGEFPNCDVGEMIVYYTALNDAQVVIVQNYLAAKYNVALGSNDFYDGDEVANGNFDYDVAGIGRISSTNIHDDAKGTGIVRVFNPSSLNNNNDFLMWGHDNGSLSALNTTNVPGGVQARMERVWRVTETGSVGTIDMQFDLTGLGPVTASDLRLLIDTDGDGSFSDGSTIAIDDAIALACNNYLFENVPSTNIGNGDRFTLGTTDLSQTPLPIELESFSGEIVEGDARLKWSTLSELNNHYFTIERSLNGKDFMTVGEVPGSGTTKLRTTYQYEDPFVPFGRLYYRLKQTDFDEAHSYSDIIMLENKAGEGTQLIAVPNPVSSGQTVNLRIRHTEQVDSKTVAVSVHDLLGRDIPVSIEADDQDQLQIRFSNTQASGIYIIRVRSPQLQGPLFTRVRLVK